MEEERADASRQSRDDDQGEEGSVSASLLQQEVNQCTEQSAADRRHGDESHALVLGQEVCWDDSQNGEEWRREEVVGSGKPTHEVMEKRYYHSVKPKIIARQEDRVLGIHVPGKCERQPEDDLRCPEPLDVISEHDLESGDLVYWAGLLRIVHKLWLTEVIRGSKTSFVRD